MPQPSASDSLTETSGRHLARLHFLYHSLSETRSNDPCGIDVALFRSHASGLSEVGKSGLPCFWPELTFDDGHISNLRLALPILQAFNLKARFFITVGWTGKERGYLGWADLKALQDSGQEIGAHGWSHTFLTECNDRELRQEVLVPRMMLQEKLGIEITTMSLPGGRYNRRVLAACREAGYSRVYTSLPEAEKPLSFLVGRVNVHRAMMIENIKALLQPNGNELRNLKHRYRAKQAAKWILSDRLYDRLWWRLQRNVDEERNDLGSDEDFARHQ